MQHSSKSTNPEDTFYDRCERFLRFVVSGPPYAATTEWGDYRAFEGYALAAFTLGEDPDRAWTLFKESLDQMEEHLAREAADPGWHAHLADFALHPLLRIYFRFRYAQRERTADDLHQWKRLEQIATGFLWSLGTRSENHNLLHLAGRYFVGGLWPDAQFADGRNGDIHRTEARIGLTDWMRNWVRNGSSEWGADIYLNVNLLALFNLVDFAGEAKLKDAASGVIDLILLEEATDAFAGAMCGAARRGYSCYRMSTRLSPSRSLHSLFFEEPANEPFNRHFIGGVLQAATSDYRIPQAIRQVALHRGVAAVEFSSTNPAGAWSPGGPSTGKHTWRSKDALLSVMQSPAVGERYTEQVWQITLSENAILFGNHPSLNPDWPTNWPPSRVIEFWKSDLDQSGNREHPLWIPGNVPPGNEGDHRPGYWQGNGCGPRGFGAGRCAVTIHQLAEKSLFDFTHIFVPEEAMDSVEVIDGWLMIRAGDAYAAIWTSSPPVPTRRGAWTGVEWKVLGRTQALLAAAGGKSEFKSFEDFMEAVKKSDPVFDVENACLTYCDPDSSEVRKVHYDAALDSGEALPHYRIQTPWGKMPLGATRLFLDVDGVKYWRDLTAALATAS